MSRNPHLTMLLALCLWLVACAPASESVEPSPTPAPPAAATVIPTPNQSALATITVPPTPQPTPESVAELPSLAGLLYRSEGGLYRLNAEEAPELLFDEGAVQATESELSPDQSQLVYAAQDDLWLVDLASGESRRLTDTPQVQEGNPQWWPARPGVIVFSYRPFEEMGPWYGYLAALDLARGQQQIIEETQGPNGPPALSPDGQTVAYEVGGSPRLYRWGEGSTEFALASQVPGEAVRFVSPAWSPDGKYLAWVLYGQLDENSQGEGDSAIVRFDLEQETVLQLHLYTILAGSGAVGSIAWSPDGQWLAVQTVAERRRVDLWAMRADGSEKQYLGLEGAVWSPDGSYLLYQDSIPEGEIMVRATESKLAEAGVWEAQVVELPANSFVQGWVEPAP